jgi:hypothetical protein
MVRALCSIVAGFTPAFGSAWGASYLGFALSSLVGFLTGFVMTAKGHSVNPTTEICLVVVGLLVQAAVYGVVLKHPDTGSIGFLRGSLVCIVYLIIIGILGGLLALGIYLALRQ